MRLLFVSLNFSPELTATGKYTGEMAQWFAARGHVVDAIAGLPHYPEWEVAVGYRARGFWRECIGGVNILRTPHFVPRPRHVTGAARVLMECSFSLASLYWWMGLLLKRPGYDVVVAVCPPMQNALLPWLYSTFRNVPFVFHVQDFQVDAAVRLRMLRTGGLGKLLSGLEEFFLKRASRVSTISHAMCRRLVEKGVDAERVLLVPNWADIHSIVPMTPDNEFRRCLGVASDQLLVMYAGAMGRKQGLDVLLRAAALMGADSRFQFALVGAGAEKGHLTDAARSMHLKNVQFLPVQPASRLPTMLAAADIHLTIQRREAADLVMPSKLTNILSSGRASVATAEKGTTLWNVLEEGDTGICVPPDDPEALRDALLRLGSDAQLRERKAANARRYAETNLRCDSILELFEGQLMELSNQC